MVRIIITAFACLVLFCGSIGTTFANEFEGLIHPSEVVRLSSQVPGVLEQIFVERGDVVSKGQVVATLKSGSERVAVEFARTHMEFLARKRERSVELARKKLISVHEQDELETEQKKAEQQLEEAQERLNSKTIVSTINGVVTERLMAPGDYAGEGPVLKVARLDPLKVEVVVPVSLFGSIKPGMRAQVRPEQPVGGVVVGKVTIVDRVIDAASNTFIVRIDLPNPALKIPSGLRCSVRFLR